jgi:hypothetical protein
MMKKLVGLSAAAMCVMFSAQVSATSASFAITSTITPDPAGTNYCETLSNNVTIQLSKDVYAAYNCAAAGTSFAAAACHANGTNKQQTITCVYTQDSSTLQWSTSTSSQCPAYDPAAGASVPVTFQGRIGFKGSSSGGSVSAAQIDGTTCDGTAALGLVPNPY